MPGRTPEEGNLRLTAAATDAIDRAVPVPAVTTDIDREPRGVTPDLGAHESPNQDRGRDPALRAALHYMSHLVDRPGRPGAPPGAPPDGGAIVEDTLIRGTSPGIGAELAV